jgi:predicted outer membrane protein
MKKLLTRYLAVLLLSATCSAVQADVTYSYGDPTPAEQAHLEKLNQAEIL